jgi:hypothetical protein
MSLFNVLAIWVLSNFAVVGFLIWRRITVPWLHHRQIAQHQDAARSIDDLQGVVWG